MEMPPNSQNPEFVRAGTKKPTICPYCTRRFGRYEHLERHIRIHTNEKPYKCSCGASFGRRDLLKRHQLQHPSTHTHPTQEKPPITLRNSQVTEPGVEKPLSGQIGDQLWGEYPAHQEGGLIESIGALEQSQLDHGHFEDRPLDAQDMLMLQDLEAFSQNMGLNLDWSLPSEPSVVQIFTGERNLNSVPTPSTASCSQDKVDSPHSLSKLPSERDYITEFCVLTMPILAVTEAHRIRLLFALRQSRGGATDTLPPLPSCHSLTRFLNGYFDGFYPHIPVMHIPTMSVENSEPELLLAMAALGAQYRHENRKSIVLFYAAKDIFEYKARKTNMTSMDMSYPSGSNSQACSFSHSEPNTDYSSGKITRLINEARCALHLIAFATWQSERNIVREAFSLQSFLATCVRECGLQELNSNTAMDWHSWIQNESQRRVKFFSFVILNLHSIAFNSPPILLSDEINLRLPCTCIEWIAPNPTKWSIFRGTNHQEQMHLQDALLYVTRHPQDPHGLPSQPIPSPLANYIILHALLQRISLTYQAFGSYNTNNHTLLNSQKHSICNALLAWTGFWQRTPESSLDPRNPNGPVPFTSAVLLGLAYVRLAFDIGSYRIASCQDAKQVADRFLKLPLPSPSPYLLPAILHATHALSIPIKLGIKFIAKSHAFVWSVQHSLCGLEFAICTNKWLSYLSDCQKTRSLSEHENRLVGWIDEIVEEGRTSWDDELWTRPSPSSNTAYLAFAVVKLWALLIKRNAQWPILKIIGDGLELYASSCETQGLESSWR